MTPSMLAVDVNDLGCEHAALVRQLARLQRQLDHVWREHAIQVAQLQAHNLRLRAQQVVLRTGLYWGVGAAAMLQRASLAAKARQVPIEAQASEAQSVICQTGCAGHAHPWLGPEGQCRRSGQACDRMDSERAPMKPVRAVDEMLEAAPALVLSPSSQDPAVKAG